LFQYAVNIAKQSSIAIVAVGDNLSTSGEGHDRISLYLPGQQQLLIESIVATGISVILILFSGRAPTIQWCAMNVDGIIEVNETYASLYY
jgi:beta-glucosidase